MREGNPLAGGATSDAEDRELVRLVQAGNRDALERLITRHQRWIYNIVLRMVYSPQDAEDATQEIFIKLLTKLSTFKGTSEFRTWLYRIVVNHVLNMNRSRVETAAMTFESYGHGLDATPDSELPDPKSVPADVQLLVQEARIGCTTGMLLCLDREQRLVYVLGHIFGVTDRVGAELLETTADAFRQKLARARRDLHNFMQDKCGLVNHANPCRCAKKTQGFIKAGYLDPNNLLFARERVTRVREVAEQRSEEIDELDAAYAAIHRDHPFQDGPDFVVALQKLLHDPAFKSTLDLAPRGWGGTERPL
jgi:RNA polymerase sigma factor (sigma-70 family)